MIPLRNKMITTNQAAVLAKVQPQTIRLWVRKYGLKAVRYGRDYLIDESEFNTFRAAHSGKRGPKKEQTK